MSSTEQQKNEQGKRVREGFLGQRMIVLPHAVKRRIAGNPLTRGIYLTAIGHYPKAVNHYIERKSGAAQYILIYCTEGMGTIEAEGNNYVLLPNNYFIIPRNTAHRYQSSDTNPWSIYWLHFTGEQADGLYARFKAESAIPQVRNLPYEEKRILQFEQVYAITEYSFQDREMEMMSAALHYFIASMIYNKEANPEMYSTGTVSNSIQFMKQHIGGRFGIEDLAAQQRISVSHYSRSFKKQTGTSPINYFNQLKVYQSCQYLYFTDRSIKEISVTLGFDDQYYFSRLFSNIMGISPSAYRKQHKART